MKSTILVFPRLGKKSELKFAIENIGESTLIH